MRRRGYTLTEILVVIAIVAILAALAGSVGHSAVQRSKIAATAAMIRVLDAGCSDYRTDWGCYPPAGPSSNLHGCLGAVRLVRVTADPPTFEMRPPHVRFAREWLAPSAAGTTPDPPALIHDAWGKAVLYANPGTVNPRHVDIWSVGRDSADAADDVGNWGPEY